MTTDELKEIASQLKNPHGENGIETGRLMHETNINMTRHAIDMLNLQWVREILTAIDKQHIKINIFSLAIAADYPAANMPFPPKKLAT